VVKPSRFAMELEAESSRGDDIDKHKSVIFFISPAA
jgi:hypothetical protein